MDCTEPTEPAAWVPAAPRCAVAPLALAGCERRRYTGVAQPFAAHAHSHYVVGIVREGPCACAAFEQLMRAAENASGEDGMKAATRSFRHALIAGPVPPL